jgi:hypothetical protein
MQTHRLAIELNSSADLSKSTPDGDEDLFLRHGPSSPAEPSDRLRSFSRRDHIDGRAAGFARKETLAALFDHFIGASEQRLR